jgi:peptidoglycan hydrolase-like amidase
VGAYGMAVRGHSYRDILLHYYSGVELGTPAGIAHTTKTAAAASAPAAHR